MWESKTFFHHPASRCNCVACDAGLLYYSIHLGQFLLMCLLWQLCSTICTSNLFISQFTIFNYTITCTLNKQYNIGLRVKQSSCHFNELMKSLDFYLYYLTPAICWRHAEFINRNKYWCYDTKLKVPRPAKYSN